MTSRFKMNPKVRVRRTERGWGGHFCAASKCLFRRNTLLEAGDIKIVVSTVGLQQQDGQTIEIAIGRHYETMVFHSEPDDKRYHDADVGRPVYFNSPWCIREEDADDKANDMHEAVVAEITRKLEQGEMFDADSTQANNEAS